MSDLKAYFEEYQSYLEPIREGEKQSVVIAGPIFESKQESKAKYKKKEVLIFSSNNYLGLSGHKEIEEAMKQAIDIFGSSVCGSRMNNGTTLLHAQLEKKMADYFGTEDAIVCNSGYMANLVALSGVSLDSDSIIITDSLNHSSINDGIKLSNGKKKIFTHNDMIKLEYILQRNESCPKKLIVVDGIYSMSGHIAPLNKICDLADKYNAMVMVDEAHSLGVVGKGICDYFGVSDRVQIKVATFSKSLGSIGGCIAASKDICDYMRFVSGPYLFTVSLAPSAVAATLKALELMEKEQWRKKKLWDNTRYFVQQAKKLGFQVNDSETPIIPITIGDEILTFKYTNELLNNGVYVCSAVFPVVPPNKSIIRITMTTSLSFQQIDEGLEIMQKVAKQMCILN